MTYSQLFLLLDDSKCSPEEFGEMIGMSGMTLRRWLKKPQKALVEKLYIPAIREACFHLMIQDRISANKTSVQEILASSSGLQHQAALAHLGISESFSLHPKNHEQIFMGLYQIGSHSDHKVEVDENQKKVFSFKKMGEEWSSRITTLWKVIQSKEITSVDKLVAYGALFYLLTPIDFIPDQIPFFGLLDDFAILGLAVGYYAKRFTII